jgi:hypothetical protein
MRSYANFLLFEDVLLNAPEGIPLITKAISDLISPTITIVEPDCHTTLGTIKDTSYSLVGKTELSNNIVLTRARIKYLLSIGQSKIHIRSMSSCTTKKGVCYQCYKTIGYVLRYNRVLDGSWLLDGSGSLDGLTDTPTYNHSLDGTWNLDGSFILSGETYGTPHNTISIPEFERYIDGSWALDNTIYLDGVKPYFPGVKRKLFSEVIYKTQTIKGDGINKTYPLSEVAGDYLRTQITILESGGVQYFPGFPEIATMTDTSITFTSVWGPEDVFTIHYYRISTNALLEYISKSYSGSLLGLADVSDSLPIVKPSVYEEMFSDSRVHLLMDSLRNSSLNIPTQYLDYCDTIADTLEKVLLMSYLYAIYQNVQ